MGINTIFQLAAHDPAELRRADALMLLPDLLGHYLGGEIAAERSNASTTGLMDTRTGGWSPELVAAIGLDPGLLPEVRRAGTRAGTWKGIPIYRVGSHDTSSLRAAG
jgi:rhamnulokinase